MELNYNPTHFASTLPKPHQPMMQLKLCQRANPKEKEILKKCPTARQKNI